MLSDKRLQYISDHPEENSPESVEMAQEILRYRRALAEPLAVIEPLGMKYVEDGNGAMVWPARYRDHKDIFLYRLDESLIKGD
ncbi:hypothetical protein LU196_13450 [Pantoea sp. Mb-10]|uniref:hypothetical protein n=1 Tax=unclassified Pantoea TaxID=2630326 RepID=UPI001E567857|nr:MULTISPECIES: hypothetical protein [unclassified Pantoea]MCE0491047.1 hypothetical protein [Pantoea sp. Mb-10]MCE0502536.1 hypothetical protein [Pantoea sp. Pb-8]